MNILLLLGSIGLLLFAFGVFVGFHRQDEDTKKKIPYGNPCRVCGAHHYVRLEATWLDRLMGEPDLIVFDHSSLNKRCIDAHKKLMEKNK